MLCILKTGLMVVDAYEEQQEWWLKYVYQRGNACIYDRLFPQESHFILMSF